MLVVSLVIALTGLLIFLIYSVISVAFKAKASSDKALIALSEQKTIPYKASFDEPEVEARMTNPPNPIALQKANEVDASPSDTGIDEVPADVEEPKVYGSTPLETPDVAGQSEEELNAPEPLQEHVSVKADAHSAMDPYEKPENVALFGSNLRHPEASIERSSANFGALENEIVAGLASQVSKPTDLDKVQFAAEMAQNGGEFMKGIFAFDSSEGGSYFSSL